MPRSLALAWSQPAPSGNMRAETDYAKLSLYLGVLSVVGAGAYWWWQRERAEAEARYERKYRESKQAIAEVQAAFGLQPTGHLDALTRSILLGLAKERLPRGLPNSAFEG